MIGQSARLERLHDLAQEMCRLCFDLQSQLTQTQSRTGEINGATLDIRLELVARESDELEQTLEEFKRVLSKTSNKGTKRLW